MKTLLVVALLALSGIAQAQTPAAKKDAAPAPAAKKEAAPAPSSPAKKELVAKLIKIQQPAIEGLARSMAEQPVVQLSQQVGPVLQARVAPEKREAVAKEIQADIKRYADEAGPIARDRAMKLAPSTIGAVLEEKFSEEELRQLVTYLESPVVRKYQQMGSEIQKSFSEKLAGELRGPLEPKVKALEQSTAKHLGVTQPVATGGEAAAAPAPAPAAKPAKK